MDGPLPDAPAGVPLLHPTCPLCGAPNDCAVARCGRFDAECWCSRVTVSHASLARVPEPHRRRSCLCARCALSPSGSG